MLKRPLFPGLFARSISQRWLWFAAFEGRSHVFAVADDFGNLVSVHDTLHKNALITLRP